MQYRAATLLDIPKVLALQEQYLFANLSEEARKEGFVTTPFTVAQLEDVIGQNGLFLALDSDEVVAYIFAASWQYFLQWPIFQQMVLDLPTLSFEGQVPDVDNSFQYGPICIHIPYRGKGLMNELFEVMRLSMRQRYPIALTFINKINARSMAAHTQKLGWTAIAEFGFNNNQYVTLGYNMERSSV